MGKKSTYLMPSIPTESQTHILIKNFHDPLSHGGCYFIE